MTPDQCLVHTSDDKDTPAVTFPQGKDQVARIMSVYVNGPICARVVSVTDDHGLHHTIISCNETDYAYVEVRYR